METKQTPAVTVVTPIYNGIEHTIPYLRSLKKVKYSYLEIVIVDDGSTDGSAEKIRAEFPDVVVLQGDGSLWWSGATNLGVKYALEHNADYIYTVNNDVELESGSIGNLVKLAKENPTALIGSMVCYLGEPDRVWYCGAEFDNKTKDLIHRSGSRDQFTKMESSEWLAGMGVLVPARAYADVGLYDQLNFPQYFGDADFSLRAKAQGYSLLVAPSSVVLVDDTSSWVFKAFEKGSWSFIFEALGSIKSQYNFKVRYKFYRRYWPGSWLGALSGFYIHFTSTMLIPFIKMKTKRIILRLFPFLARFEKGDQQ